MRVNFRNFLILMSTGFFFGCAATQPQSYFSIEAPYSDLSFLEDGQILHLATGRLLTEEELMNYLSGFSVVYVGESHDSKNDHVVQLKVLKGLNEKFPGQMALGMEMLRRPSQKEVDAYIRGELTDRQFAKVWLDNWDNLNYYKAILEFAKDNKIPIVALNAGKDLQEAVKTKGPEGLDEEMQKRLPEIDYNDPYHLAFAKGIFGGHEGGSNIAEVFHRIQSLWDETMAQTAAEFLQSDEGKDRKLVVLAGGYHVRYGFGIPRRLFRRLPLRYTILTPYAVEIAEEKQANMMDVQMPAFPMRVADIYWGVVYEGSDDEPVLLGVTYNEVEEGEGVRIIGIMPGSPADKAGVQKDDILVSMDGEAINEGFDLKYQVGLHKSGEESPLEVLRGEERLKLNVIHAVVKHGEGAHKP